MVDLGTQNAPEAEKAKIVSMLSERFNDLVMETMIGMASSEQREQINKALDNPEGTEEKLVNIASEIPGLAETAEDSMLKEYELIKHAMNLK